VSCGGVAVSGGASSVLTAVAPSAGTSPVDTAKGSFTCGTNLAFLATASASKPTYDQTTA
jgi:hypothetical protein